MSSPSTPRSPIVSANQDHKRAQIIAAARDVLARDGLAGCTTRSVADASPLTKSAIHYYFSDINDIIDAAVAESWIACSQRVASAAPRSASRTRWWTPHAAASSAKEPTA